MDRACGATHHYKSNYLKNGLSEIRVTGSENDLFFHLFYRWRLLADILRLRRLQPASTLQNAETMKKESPRNGGLVVHFRRPSRPNHINQVVDAKPHHQTLLTMYPIPWSELPVVVR